jgi:hypothetical protein
MILIFSFSSKILESDLVSSLSSLNKEGIWIFLTHHTHWLLKCIW